MPFSICPGRRPHYVHRVSLVRVSSIPRTFGVLHAMFAAFILLRLNTESLTQDHPGSAHGCSNSNDGLFTSADSDVADHLGNDSASVRYLSPRLPRHN